MTTKAAETTLEQRHAQALALTPGTPEAAQELLGFLGDPSWRVRKAALLAFERFRDDKEIVRPLVSALADGENAGLRSAAAEALGRMGELAVPALVVALGTPDSDQRKFVVEVLGAIGTPAAQTALLGALRDSDDNVRSAVADSLGRGGGSGTIELLLRELKAAGGDLQLSAYLLDALARVGARLPVADLEQWLARPGLERLVYPLLGLSLDPRGATSLLDALTRSSRGARGVAVRALERLWREVDVRAKDEIARAVSGRPEARAALLDAARDTDDALASAAVNLLATLRDVSLAPALLEAAACRPFVQTAVQAVTAMGAPACAALLGAYDGADVESRVLFVEVIEAVGDAGMSKQLVQIAGGPDARPAEAAVRALAKLAGIEAVDELFHLLESSDPEVRREVALALSGIGLRFPQPVASRVVARLAAAEVQPELLLILGTIGRAEDVQHLLAAVHHRDPEVRRAALEACLSQREPVDEGTLIFALADEHPRVRAAAARVLGSYRSERVIEALLVATRDEDPWVVAEAVRALGHIGGERAVSTLQMASGSSASQVAIAALQGLFRLNPQGLSAAIRRALGHADAEVAREALQTSMRLGEELARPVLLEALQHRSWHVRLAAADMLGNRGIAVPHDVLEARQHAEPEALVREALLRLMAGPTRA